MSQKPPGSFGWFGGVSATSSLASSPVEFVEDKVRKHGPVFCAKVMSYACVFTGGYQATRELFTSPAKFPPHLSLLDMVKKAVGSVFLLDPSGAHSWREALHMALYDGEPSGSLSDLPPLRREVQEQLEQSLRPYLQRMVASGEVEAFYSAAKRLANEVVFQLVLGMSVGEAEDDGLLLLQTNQFRGCEAVPVEGVPLVESAYETGIKAREKLTEKVANRVRTGRLGVVGKVIAQRCGGEGPQAIGEVLAYLLHGMVPKALASGLLHTWLEITHSGREGELAGNCDLQRAFVMESIRLHPPVGLMARGVKCTSLAGHSLPSRHGEWKAWAGIHSANRDEDAYPRADRFDPSRWMAPDGRAPPPLTFGHGPRMCPGAGLSVAFITSATRLLLDELQCAPELEMPRSCPVKYRPVKRPLKDVRCSFRKLKLQ
eukprot:Sspe_Gene.3423::Locus_1134_Transcript_2_2_Confidence_0.750_Length_1542::g.3423::m.3423